MFSIEDDLIAVLIAIVLSVGGFFYGVHKGESIDRGVVAQSTIKGVQRSDAIHRQVMQQSASQLDRSISYWMRD